MAMTLTPEMLTAHAVDTAHRDQELALIADEYRHDPAMMDHLHVLAGRIHDLSARRPQLARLASIGWFHLLDTIIARELAEREE